MTRMDAPVWLALAVFGGLAAVPSLAGDYWTGQLARYVLFGLFAVSLALVWGRAGILCFGQAMFFGAGGYAMALLTLGIVEVPGLSGAWPALALAVVLAAALALLLGFFLFWGAGISGAYLAVVTLALAVILEQVVRGWPLLGESTGLSSVPALPVGDNPWDPKPTYYVLLAIAAAVYFGLVALLASRFGVLLTALRTHPQRLAYLGYSVVALRIAAFVLGGAVAGLAGALFVATDRFASPSLIGFALSAEVLIWVALGGRSVLLAAFLAAIGILIVQGFLSEALGEWWLLALGALFMVSVALVPNGLLATPLLWLQSRLRRAP